MTKIAQILLDKEYPDHVCPPQLELHGDARPGYHGPGGGILAYVVLQKTQCGCDVVGNGTLMHPLMVEPCDQHRATMYPELDRLGETVPYVFVK